MPKNNLEKNNGREKDEEKSMPQQLAFRTKGAEELAQKLIDAADILGCDVAELIRLASEAGLPTAIKKIAAAREEQAAKAVAARKKLLG